MSKEEKLEVLRRVVADQSIYDIVCALRGPDFFADSLKFLFTARIRDLANVRLGVRRHSRQVDFETIEVAYKESHYALERGADVWRLDVAHGVPPDVWREVRKDMPNDAYLIGEVMDDARLWLFDKFHGTMNYPLYEALLRFFVYEEITAEEFLNWLELLSTYYGPAEYTMYNFLDNHDVERFLGLVGDKRKYFCALTFLMTYKGIPAIYYGDEVGLENMNVPSMEISRTPMEWNAKEWDKEILKTTKELIKLRRGSKALQKGIFKPVTFKDKLLVYRRALNNENILVAINYSKKKQHLSLSFPFEVLFQSGLFDRVNIQLGPFSSITIKEL